MSNYASSTGNLWNVDNFHNSFDVKYGWVGLEEGEYWNPQSKGSSQTVTLSGQVHQLYQIYGAQNVVVQKGLIITENGDVVCPMTGGYNLVNFQEINGDWHYEDSNTKIYKPTSTSSSSTTTVNILCKLLGWIRLYPPEYVGHQGSTYYYYPVFREVVRKIGSYSWSNASTVSNQYVPYQTIPQTTLSVNYTLVTKSYSTKEIVTTTSTGTGTKTVSATYYTSPGSRTYATYYASYSSAYNAYTNTSYSWSISIADWANKQYTIEKISDKSFNIYPGKTVGNDFINAHRVKLRKWNEYGENITYPRTTLEIGYMSATIYSDTDSTFQFNYDISGFTETSTTLISYTVPSAQLHHLKSSGWNANLQRKTVFHINEDVEEVDFSDAGSLIYDDDTTIDMEDVTVTAQSTTCTMNGHTVTLPATVGLGTPSSFTMAYSITATYFGTLTFTDACSTAEDAQIKEIVLSGEKHVFNPNDVIGFGDNAQIDIIAMDDSTIETISSANIMSRIRNIDAKYGSLASNYLQDGKVTLTFTCEGFPMEHEICFCYDELTLSLNVSGVTTSYIVDPDDDEFEFDYSGLVVKKTTHTNTYDDGEVTTTETETTLTSSQYTVGSSPSAINYSQDQTYVITVSHTNTWGQIASGTFNMYTVPLRIIAILFSGTGDSIKYWDNDKDTFKLPEDLTFTVTYNDSSKNVEVSYEDLKYYINSACTDDAEIEEGEIISSGNLEVANTIFFYSEDYDFGGSYRVTFIPDPIVSVELKNSISLFLGNRLNKSSVKSQVVLTCTHQSTETSEIDGSTSPGSFNFKNTNIITSIPVGNLVVTIEGTGDKEITNTASKVTWIKPYAKLVINDTNFQTSYNNTVDYINLPPLTATVEYYEDALFVTKCDYQVACAYSSTSTNLYNKFVVVGNGQLADSENYHINAGDKLNVNMGGQSQLDLTFDLKVLNMFYDADDLNQPVYVTQYVTGVETITVLEILNITGIKLLNVKREYVVGETFLNENDNTRIRVFYNDASTPPVARTYECDLRVGLTALNVYPTPGTEFKNVVNDKIVTITSASDYNVSVQYSIDVKANFTYNETITHKLVVLYLENYECPDGNQRTKYFLVNRTVTVGGETKDATVVGDEGRTLAPGVPVSALEVYGYIDNVNDNTKNAIVVLFNDYVPPMDGGNNVSVKFPCYVAGNADLINKCHFGIMFGNNNSKNRLFVSGNPDYKNKDWHTGQVDTTQTTDETMINGNYGYFEDLSECVYGETDNAVVGYDIVSNDKLLVLKNHSDKETTVYFRQPQLVTAINSSGTAVTGLDDETLYQEEFSLSKGNNSVAGINPYAVLNFNGDSLFISNENQVVGLDLTGIIGDNQRYANTRSYYIDEDLKHYDLSKAFLWSNNKYLFVVLPTKIYVAHFQMKSEETKQYEWFVIDVPNVSSIIEIDNVLYFGTYDGGLFRFTDNYRDAKKIFVGYGVVRLSANEETDIITASNYLSEIDTTKKHYFRPVPLADLVTNYIYYSLGTIISNASADCDFYVNNADTRNVIELVARVNGVTDSNRRELLLNRIKDGVPVYFNGIYSSVTDIECVEGSILADAWGKPYFLKEYDGADSLHHLYQVIDENGNIVPIRELYRARLCLRVTEDTEMVEIDPVNSTFKLKSEGEILDIVQYNNQPLSAFRGEVIEYSNVEAFYIPRPETMGTLEQQKTVWSFTLTNDSNVPSELDLCYATNKIPTEKLKTLASISKEQLGFSFEDFNFEKVDFDKNIVPRTYTHKRVLSGVKFLCLAFRNYKDTNSVLGSTTITYTLPFPSYGGD